MRRQSMNSGCFSISASKLDIGENVFDQAVEVQIRVEANEITGVFKSFHALKAGAWRQADAEGQILVGNVRLQMCNRQDIPVDRIQFDVFVFARHRPSKSAFSCWFKNEILTCGTGRIQ